MTDIPISQRLKTVAKFIPKGAILADIGSDHAYLPCYAFMNGWITKGIAGEVNKGPLASARETIERFGLSQHISTRLGSGLTVLDKGEVNAITIAGMGGDLIRYILEEGKERLGPEVRLILQPNVAEKHVRLWLQKEGWAILNEQILEEDGHIYEIIVAEKETTREFLTDEELLFGPYLLKQKGEPFHKKWTSELRKRERILESLTHATSSSEREERRQAILSEMKQIKEVLE